MPPFSTDGLHKAGQALERALPSFYMAGLCRHGQALGSQSGAAVPFLPLVSSADHSSPGEPGHGTGATFFHGWPPWDGQTLGKQTREVASPSSMAGLCLLFHSWLSHVLLGLGCEAREAACPSSMTDLHGPDRP